MPVAIAVVSYTPVMNRRKFLAAASGLSATFAAESLMNLSKAQGERLPAREAAQVPDTGVRRFPEDFWWGGRVESGQEGRIGMGPLHAYAEHDQRSCDG